MHLRNELELLKIENRKQIIQEVNGPEEYARRQQKYIEHLCYNEGMKELIVDQLMKTFKSETVEKMRPSVSNVAIVPKVVDKLAKVYTEPAKRRLGEDSAEENLKMEGINEYFKLDTTYKKQNVRTKLHKNSTMFLKPIFEETYDPELGQIKVMGDVKPIPMPPFKYSVVDKASDRTQALCYVLSDFFYKKPSSYSPLDAGNKNHIKELPSVDNATGLPDKLVQSFDGVDQTIADSPEDEQIGNNQEYIFWSDNFHFTCNVHGEYLDPKTKEVFTIEPDEFGNIDKEQLERIKNPILTAPFVDFNIGQDDVYWAEGGEALVDGAISLNYQLTNLKHIGITQGFGLFYAIGKDLPASFDIGPDTGIRLEMGEAEDPTPEIGFANSGAPLADLRGNLELDLALYLTTHKLSTTGIATQMNSGVSVASGVALAIDKSESLEDIGDQQSIFKDGEKDVVVKIMKWYEFFNFKGMLTDKQKALMIPVTSIEENFQVVYTDPQILMSEGEKLDNLQKRKNLDINTKAELIAIDRGIEDSEAEEIEAKINDKKKQNAADFVVDPKGEDDDPEKEDDDQEETEE